MSSRRPAPLRGSDARGPRRRRKWEWKFERMRRTSSFASVRRRARISAYEFFVFVFERAKWSQLARGTCRSYVEIRERTGVRMSRMLLALGTLFLACATDARAAETSTGAPELSNIVTINPNTTGTESPPQSADPVTATVTEGQGIDFIIVNGTSEMQR